MITQTNHSSTSSKYWGMITTFQFKKAIKSFKDRYIESLSTSKVCDKPLLKFLVSSNEAIECLNVDQKLTQLGLIEEQYLNDYRAKTQDLFLNTELVLKGPHSITKKRYFVMALREYCLIKNFSNEVGVLNIFLNDSSSKQNLKEGQIDMVNSILENLNFIQPPTRSKSDVGGVKPTLYFKNNVDQLNGDISDAMENKERLYRVCTAIRSVVADHHQLKTLAYSNYVSMGRFVTSIIINYINTTQKPKNWVKLSGSAFSRKYNSSGCDVSVQLVFTEEQYTLMRAFLREMKWSLRDLTNNAFIESQLLGFFNIGLNKKVLNSNLLSSYERELAQQASDNELTPENPIIEEWINDDNKFEEDAYEDYDEEGLVDYVEFSGDKDQLIAFSSELYKKGLIPDVLKKLEVVKFYTGQDTFNFIIKFDYDNEKHDVFMKI